MSEFILLQLYENKVNKLIRKIDYPNDSLLSKWNILDKFYVINHNKLKYIPKFTSLFSIENSNKPPYAINNFYNVIDPFNLLSNNIYFIAYNQITPNTTPLYFYKDNEILIPSFNVIKSKPLYFKIYVIHSENIEDINHLNFKCVNNKCIPYTKDIKGILNINKNNLSSSLTDCIEYSKKNYVHTENMLDFIKKKKYKYSNYFFYIILVILLFLFYPLWKIIRN